MNKLKYIFCLICLCTIWSCNWNSDPLELVYPGTDLSGGNGNNGNGETTTEEELINNFETILNTTWYGWKISGTTTDQQPCTVFFIFKTAEKKVTTISTVKGRKTTIEYAIAVNEKKQVVVNFAGTDVDYLGDESFIILEAVEGTISCKGSTTGTDYKMTNADQDEVDAIDVKDMVDKMQEAKMLSGVIRDADGNFFAHYYVNKATNKFQITYLDNGVCKQEVRGFESTTSAINLDNKVSLKSVEILSVIYEASTYSLSGTGVKSFKMASNEGTGTYVKDGRHQFKLTKALADGTDVASAMLTEMNAWSIFDRLEINCSDFAAQYGAVASLVLCGSFPSQSYEFLVPKAEYIRAEEPDRAYFEYNKTLYGKVEIYEAAKTNIPTVINTWYHKDGLYLVPNQEGGKTYLYVLSPATGKWFKFVQTA